MKDEGARPFALSPLPFALLILLTLPLPSFAASPTANAETNIRTLLATQVTAWNRRDLNGYMQGYWSSPDLEFFSGAKITRGWEPTLQHYREKYQAKGKEMGVLTFTNLEVKLLGPDIAFVTGEWALKMKSGESPHGLFTLLLRKFPEGWRIVHDHSS
jgi:beta-aspartyl-peptidase (threonine type)